MSDKRRGLYPDSSGAFNLRGLFEPVLDHSAAEALKAHFTASDVLSTGLYFKHGDKLYRSFVEISEDASLDQVVESFEQMVADIRESLKSSE